MISGLPGASDSLPAGDWSQFSDEDLVNLHRERPGSQEARTAAAELLGRYRSLVYQWCWGYTREREAAMDLAQEVLVNAYRGLGSFDGKALFSSWLFAVARNRCLSHVRRHQPDQEDEEILARLPSSGPSPDATLDREQRQQHLRRVMREHLSEREEEAIWLRIIEKMSVDQITAVLGLENATGARSLLQNARRKLRAALGGQAEPFREDI